MMLSLRSNRRLLLNLLKTILRNVSPYADNLRWMMLLCVRLLMFSLTLSLLLREHQLLQRSLSLRLILFRWLLLPSLTPNQRSLILLLLLMPSLRSLMLPMPSLPAVRHHIFEQIENGTQVPCSACVNQIC